jgi:16S rRNA (guanine527-N7)-methyltransferase
LIGLPLLNVSRETEEALLDFKNLVVEWNPTINLVSKNSISDLWDRHIVDSAQIFMTFLPKDGLWVDFGTGGGFPGLVLAILGRQLCPELRFSLVESDRRKCSFLKKVARDLALTVDIKNSRVESVDLKKADYVSARAVCQLNELFFLIENIVSRETKCFFLKGGTYKKEVANAQKNWDFNLSTVDSVTSENGRLLILSGLERVVGKRNC